MTNIAYNVTFSIVVIGLVTWISRSLGLSWPVSVALAVAALAASFKLLTIQIGVKKRSRYDLERFIHDNVLILRENGAWLDVKHRTSPLTFRIIRASGTDSAAEIVLSVPRAAWSEPKLSDLVRIFEMNGISFVTEEAAFTRKSSLIETHLMVANIWVKAAGAKPARIAHLVLDTFSVGPAELLDLRVEGSLSARWKLHREEFLNHR